MSYKGETEILLTIFIFREGFFGDFYGDSHGHNNGEFDCNKFYSFHDVKIKML